jgi:fibronectin type 3 domain-containing protein
MVAVSPAEIRLSPGAIQQLSAEVANSPNSSVRWSTTVGTISATGLLSIPLTVGEITVIATATSVADPSKVAHAHITVVALDTPPRVGLSWNSNPGESTVSYSVYRSTMRGGPYGLEASAVRNLTYMDTTVQSGTTYHYVATAVDASGKESAYSTEATIFVP